MDHDAARVGDVDGDGVPDIVTASSGIDTVDVFLGQRDGAFAAPLVYPSLPPGPLALGDLNGDGRSTWSCRGAPAPRP